MDFYDIKERDINGVEVDFSRFKNRVVFGVNVASMCSFAMGEYRQMSELALRYGKRNFDIVALPSRQYAQEYVESCKVKDFAGKNGPADLIILENGNVKGKNARPVYRWMRENNVNIDTRWNYTAKFVVSVTGEVKGTSNTHLQSDIENGFIGSF